MVLNMADIKKELNDIKTAIYGRDVRGSIHDGIDKINKESEESKQKASEAHDVMESIINDGFDNAALEVNFEQKLDDKIGQLQPEWTQFQTDVTSQLNEESNENPNFRNGKNDLPPLSEELITSATVILGSGWTGSVASGFTHSIGNTEELELTFPNIDSDSIYNVEMNITNPAVNDNGQSDYWFSLGNSPEFETYRGKRNNVIWGVKTISGNKLILRPWENFEGTINISVKKILAPTEPYSVYRDSDNNIAMEQRISRKDIRSFYFGEYAGRYANEFATENVVFGDGAGQSITSGFWNVFLGSDTGKENTVGTRNVFAGRRAGAENVTGNRNNAIGSWAFMRNISGENNNAMGADALYYNETGNGNVAIGTVAIGQNPNGNYLIGIGDRVMSGSQGGSHSFAAGQNALYYNKGNHNAAIGQQAGYQNREGSHNFYVGYRAGMLNRTGDNIVAIGNEALFNNTEHSNIAIGNRAQYKNETGKYNIAIGHQAGYEKTEGNYAIAIGFRAAYSNKSDDVVAIGKQSLENSLASGSVGVGANTLRNFKGERNTAVGFNAGSHANGDGDFNTFIGSNAGNSATSGDNNILIGFNTQKPTTTSSNALNIGDVIKSRDMTTGIVELQKLQLTNLPTSAPSESGMVWNDNGTLKISA